MYVDRRTGEEISEFDHILQSIEMILTTRIGTRVMRRDFGSRLPELLSKPLNAETITAIYAAANEAIATWEPRVRVLGSRINLDDADNGIYDLTLFFSAKGQNTERRVRLRSPEPTPEQIVGTLFISGGALTTLNNTLYF